MIIVHRVVVLFFFEDEPNFYGVWHVEHRIGYCGDGGEGGCLSIFAYVVSLLELSHPQMGKGSLSHFNSLAHSFPANSLSLTL